MKTPETPPPTDDAAVCGIDIDMHKSMDCLTSEQLEHLSHGTEIAFGVSVSRTSPGVYCLRMDATDAQRILTGALTPAHLWHSAHTLSEDETPFLVPDPSNN